MKTTRTRVGLLVAALLTTVGAGLVAAPFVTAAAAPPAKVGVCHATTSDTHPYVWLSVSTSSTRYQGHLMHRTDPPHTWKTAGTWNGTAHQAGDGKRDFIEGIDTGLTRAWCLGLVTPTPTPTDTATSTPTPTDTATSTPTETPTTPTTTPTTTPPIDTGSPTPSTSSPAATTTAPEPATPTTSAPGTLAHTAGTGTTPLLVLAGLTLVGLGALTMIAVRRTGTHA